MNYVASDTEYTQLMVTVSHKDGGQRDIKVIVEYTDFDFDQRGVEGWHVEEGYDVTGCDWIDEEVVSALREDGFTLR